MKNNDNKDFLHTLQMLDAMSDIRESKKEEKQLATKEDIEIATLSEELESRKQDRKQRGKFAKDIFRLICFYLGTVFVIIILKGCDVLRLDNTIINVLLTTTTANVIGIFIIVAKYLFHHQS